MTDPLRLFDEGALKQNRNALRRWPQSSTARLPCYIISGTGAHWKVFSKSQTLIGVCNRLLGRGHDIQPSVLGGAFVRGRDPSGSRVKFLIGSLKPHACRHCGRMTGKPLVIGSPVGFGPDKRASSDRPIAGEKPTSGPE